MVEVGDIGLMMYSGDNYILVPLTDAIPGERGLIVPLANNEYRVVKLASSALVGDRVVVVHDRRGNYWAVK